MAEHLNCFPEQSWGAPLRNQIKYVSQSQDSRTIKTSPVGKGQRRGPGSGRLFFKGPQDFRPRCGLLDRRICASFIFQRLLPRPGSAGVTLGPVVGGLDAHLPLTPLACWSPARAPVCSRRSWHGQSLEWGSQAGAPFPCWSHRVRCGPQRKSRKGASQAGNSSAASPEGWGSGGGGRTPLSVPSLPKLSPSSHLSAPTPSQFPSSQPAPCPLCFASAASPAVKAAVPAFLASHSLPPPPVTITHTPRGQPGAQVNQGRVHHNLLLHHSSGETGILRMERSN